MTTSRIIIRDETIIAKIASILGILSIIAWIIIGIGRTGDIITSDDR